MQYIFQIIALYKSVEGRDTAAMTSLPRPSTSLTYAVLAVVLVLSGLDQTILATALPAITRDLHGQDRASWVFSAYLIASTTVIPLYGKLADRWGTRALLLGATGLFMLGSLACGLCTGMDGLIAARALQGLGGGGLMTLTLLAVTALFPPEQRGRQQSLLGAAYGLSVMVGPLVGALLVQYLSWHWAFLVNVPVALAAWVVLARADFGQPRPSRHPLDLAGAALLAGALVCLLLATRQGGGGTNWVLAAVAAKLFLSWLWVERRAKDPIVPLALFRSAGFAAAALVSTLSGVALFTAVVFLPFYLQAALLKTPTASAWHLLPLMVGITVAASRSGKALRANVPARSLALLATLAMTSAFAALAWVCGAAPSNAWAISLCVLPLGAGLGMLFPLVTVVAQRTAQPRHLGIATAAPIMLRALGGAIGVALMGGLLTRQLAGALGAGASGLAAGRGAAAVTGISHPLFAAALASGLQALFASAALACLCACLAALWLPHVMAVSPPGATMAHD